MNNRQYLKEVQKALENDNTLYGKVWRRSKGNKNPAEVVAEIAKERGTQTDHIDARWKFIQYILVGGAPPSPSKIGERVQNFIKRGYEYLSPETIRILEKRGRM
jgi:hypothetical protein